MKFHLPHDLMAKSQLLLSYSNAVLLAGILNDTRDPYEFASVQKEQGVQPEEIPHDAQRMLAADEILRGHGIKELDGCAYVERGDTAIPTVIYDPATEEFHYCTLDEFSLTRGG